MLPTTYYYFHLARGDTFGCDVMFKILEKCTFHNGYSNSTYRGTAYINNQINVYSHLYDSHVEACLLRELLADVSRGLRRGHERGFQSLELFGLDGGARAPSLRARVLLLVLVVVSVLI